MVRRLLLLSVCAVLTAVGCQPKAPALVEPLPEPLFGPVKTPAGSQNGRREGTATIERIRPEPGWYIPPYKRTRKWRWIIIHHSASAVDTPESMDRFHRQVRGWDELGYHFVIGNGINTVDGKVYVGSRWPKQKHGAHCRVRADDDNRYNLYGIGICVIGNFEKTRPTPRQISSLVRLIKYLRQEFGDLKVIGHRDVDPYTVCPGRFFPMKEILSRVGGK